jgi:hypothetical protein
MGKMYVILSLYFFLSFIYVVHHIKFFWWEGGEQVRSISEVRSQDRCSLVIRLEAH